MAEKNENSVSDICADDVLCAALDVGEHILKNGGEIHRVEDTIERICKSFGAVHVEVFTIISLIVASVRMPNGEHSQQMRRIYRISNNLYMVEEMNEVSRELCSRKLPISKLRERILNAKNNKPYPPLLIYLGAIMAAGGFAMFFGGNILDGLSAAIVGVFVTFFDRHTPSFMNTMIMTVVNSVFAGIISICLSSIGLGNNPDKIMIGTIMLLIPGLALGNSIRDMLGGDVISGSVRLIQSILLALMIAFGFAVAITVMGGAV